jgi:uncharacterized FlaG/YvyC family protein
MSSINILSGATKVTMVHGPVATSVSKSVVPTDLVTQPADVVDRFKDFRQVVQKSSDQLDSSRHQLEQAVQELKRTADTAGRALGFRIDPAINGSIVTVSNLETGQIIRQIPDEVVVRVAHSIEKMKGLLFDGKL